MSLVHEFVSIWKPAHKEIVYAEDVYEYIEQGQLKKYASLEVPDDVLQNILYDSSGHLLLDVKFNEWGISVYENNELMKWIKFLQLISEKTLPQNKEHCECLLEFILKSYTNKKLILHFGI